MIILFSLYLDDDVTVEKCRVTQGILLVFLIFGFLFLSRADEDLKRKKYEEKIVVEEKAALISGSVRFLDDWITYIIEPN